MTVIDAAIATATDPAVEYTVSIPDPRAHRFHVVCRVARPAPGAQYFALTAWIRGSYRIRDFAKHVVRVRAHDEDGTELVVQRLDKNRLRVAPGAGALYLEYEVHAFDASVRKAYLDGARGFFNPGSLCYRPLEIEDRDHVLNLARPAAPECADWRVFTTLPAQAVDADGWGRYQAADYETLLDHPFELGAHRVIDYRAGDVPHALVLAGAGADVADGERLARDLAAICTAQRALFGGEPALPRYLFLCQLSASGYGGLEHRASSALVAARESMPRAGDAVLRRGYRDFLGLCSHEYFHQWNVKRITPARLAASDLLAEAYTRDLWAYEGVTSYYDDYFLLRAGIVDAPAYLDLLAGTATRVARAPGHAVQSLADASFEAWIKYYQPDADSPDALASYYTKGALVALLLDLELRRHAVGSLDEVMRALWRRYGAVGEPVPEGALEAVATELSGLDLSAFFDAAVRGTGPLPLAESLAAFGVHAERRPAHGVDDVGGRNGGAPPPVDFGLRLAAGSVRLSYVRHGGAAERAGLQPDDELVALDGERLRSGQWARRLEALRPGQTVGVDYFRDDRLLHAELVCEAPRADTWTLTLAEVDGEVARRRLAWLGA